jgi:hypothetical protein
MALAPPLPLTSKVEAQDIAGRNQYGISKGIQAEKLTVRGSLELVINAPKEFKLLEKP